jgi:hypothetical protein
VTNPQLPREARNHPQRSGPVSPMRPGQREADSNHLGPRRRRRALSAVSVLIVALMVLTRQAGSEEATTYVLSASNKSCGEYLRAGGSRTEGQTRAPGQQHLFDGTTSTSPVTPTDFSPNRITRSCLRQVKPAWRVKTRIFGEGWRGLRTIVAKTRSNGTLMR